MGDEVFDYLHPHLSATEYHGACRRHMDEYTAEEQERIRIWLRLGRENPWISRAYDPPFSELSFCICADIRELMERILFGNWCLGQAYALDDICFINQVDGGEEWLTIKGGTAFESVTMRTYGESSEAAAERLRRTIEQIQQATEIQCRRLEYAHSYEETTPEDGTVVREESADGKQILVLSARLQYRDGREERRRYRLRARPGHEVQVLKNGLARFVLSTSRRSGVLLEYFWHGPQADQIASIPTPAVEDRLGSDFYALTPVERLHRLLPHLVPTR